MITVSSASPFSAWVNKWINQMAHVGWGAFLTLAIQPHYKWGWYVVLCGAALKELAFEGKRSDLLDLVFWCVGIGLGLVVNYL